MFCYWIVGLIVSFYWIDETDDYITLLPLPIDFCHITTNWTMGFRFAIDLVYFDRFIAMPQQIPELYNAYRKFCKKREDLYKGEDLAPYQYYLVPVDKGWCFTWDIIHPDKVPPLSSSMGSALDTLSYRDLLKNRLALDLYKVIALQIPLDDKTHQTSIPYDLAMKITQVIQSSLPSNIKVFTSPFESDAITTDESSRFNELIDIGNNNFYATAGVQKGSFGSGEVNTSSSLKASSDVDYAYVQHMYRQYENFINWQIGLKTKKYNWQVHMFGNRLEKSQEISDSLNVVKTANTGILHLQAARGLEPFQVKSQMLLEDKLQLRDLMKPIQSMFTTPANKSSGGRPQSNDTALSDAGVQTRDNDSNANR